VKLYLKIFILLTSVFLIRCKQEAPTKEEVKKHNSVKYATGFSIEKHEGYTVLEVTNPWPNATKKFTYILQKAGATLPKNSTKDAVVISVPVKKIVVTSTTHIPSLEMLGVENSLVGFPKLDYISSKKVRDLIHQNKITELGNNQSLNIEQLLQLQPDVIIGYGLDNSNPVLTNVERSGLKVMFNGDWNEQNPLGKAEWIKFFGALYDKSDLANTLFEQIEKEYQKTLNLVQKTTKRPTVLAGDIFEDKWYLPQGTSWAATFLKEAKGTYLWANTKGTGSLGLSFETVLDRGKDADIWITSGQFSTLNEMTNSNPHYEQFKAFKIKNVYSFNRKKGEKGGVLYYELAPNRPDIVLKDIVKILHPELLNNYKPYFFEKLK
jgi:iron complex transport system substrate-binding protein